MPKLTLTVLSLRYSSWSMRPWLVLTHAGAKFETETVTLPHMQKETETTSLEGIRNVTKQLESPEIPVSFESWALIYD